MKKNYETFTSWEDMYRHITTFGELYNAEQGIYIFEYNNAGALCVYDNISTEQARELAALSKKDGELWAAFLGAGGTILDDSDLYEKRDHQDIREKYLQPSYEYCQNTFHLNGWRFCSL